ncbi:unnamed protein product [Cladocopium goreaui]|uniref:Uncharacterized protein n=1 Tax=Cladocopium goreaui TaxID=2562237 RepID=A0A9P1DFX8_9DINO|nr:unnamed protein product [Cladocopium goreaui]
MSLRIASFLLALCFADASLKHNKAPKQVLALDHDGQTQCKALAHALRALRSQRVSVLKASF